MGVPNVKQKLTISGGSAPTISGIQDAMGALRQLGAPAEGGKLTLQQNINGWAIFIEWVPEAKAKAKAKARPPRRYRVQRRIRDNPWDNPWDNPQA